METSFTDRWIRKFRILTLSLILSGTLNIGLLSAFIAMLLQENQEDFSFPQPSKIRSAAESTNQHLISSMSKLSFRELCAYLTNKDPVEDGYAKRDIALAVLTAYRHFDLDKALAGSVHQRRQLILADGQTIEMFPGLTDDQFKAVLQFGYLEKWPLTPKGLFKLLQTASKPRDPTLEQAFILSPQFYALQLLFQKTDAPQDPSRLIELACEGDWDLLDRFAREQTQMLDLSVDKRRRLLLTYLCLKSPMAAELLVQTDFSFALKRLNDQGIVDLLDLLKGEMREKFSVELSKAPRSDLVLQKSGHASIPLPAAVEPEPALPLAGSPWVFHTVKDGESLWKIARQYKVKVEEISKANDLEQDRLYPGMTLRIPQ